MPCKFFIPDANRTSCQFNRSENDLIACSDGLACKFHLPLTDNNENETVKAKWGQGELQTFNKDILKNVETIYAHITQDFSGVVFPGAINFSGHQLNSNFDQAVFHGKVYFRKIAFKNESSFKGTIFDAEVNFEQADFRNSISFCSAKFNGPCNFTKAEFQQDSYFDGAVFTKEINLSEATFQKDASFEGTVFDAEVNFQQAHFENSISFRSAKFNGPCYFTRANFQQDSYFNSAVFTKEINLSEATFQKDASFTGVSFEGETLFNSTRFEKKSSFDSVEFSQKLSFNNVHFRGEVTFKNAQFKGDVTFKKSLFQYGVDFQGAIFHKRADFTNTQFLSHMKFVNAQFLLEASFNKVTKVTDKEHSYFFPDTDFSNSIFKKSISFTNQTFSTTTRFEGCVFHVAPKFQGCKLNQDTIFPHERNFKDHSKSAAPSYRTLKLDMENSRAHKEEAMFNALEQKCQLDDPETPCMVKCFSRLYGWTSGYGQSLGLPIFWMIIVSLIFFSLYRYLSIFSVTELSWKSLAPVIGFTIEQSVSPFKVWRLTDSGPLGWLCSCVGLVNLKIIATLHSLLFLAFFGLFILVLRWRFKRG